MTVKLRSFELKVHATGRRLEGYAALFDIETRIGHLVESAPSGAHTKCATWSSRSE